MDNNLDMMKREPLLREIEKLRAELVEVKAERDALRETNRALELNATERLDKKAARIDNLENELARVVDKRDALQARIDGAVRGFGLFSRGMPKDSLVEARPRDHFSFDINYFRVFPVLILKDESKTE